MEIRRLLSIARTMLATSAADTLEKQQYVDEVYPVYLAKRTAAFMASLPVVTIPKQERKTKRPIAIRLALDALPAAWLEELEIRDAMMLIDRWCEACTVGRYDVFPYMQFALFEHEVDKAALDSAIKSGFTPVLPPG